MLGKGWTQLMLEIMSPWIVCYTAAPQTNFFTQKGIRFVDLGVGTGTSLEFCYDPKEGRLTVTERHKSGVSLFETSRQHNKREQIRNRVRTQLRRLVIRNLTAELDREGWAEARRQATLYANDVIPAVAAYLYYLENNPYLLVPEREQLLKRIEGQLFNDDYPAVPRIARRAFALFLEGWGLSPD